MHTRRADVHMRVTGASVSVDWLCVVQMSRNNLIGVVRHGKTFYVLLDLNADTEWDYARCVEKIEAGSANYIRSTRAAALLKAHQAQTRLMTEYGVREIRL